MSAWHFLLCRDQRKPPILSSFVALGNPVLAKAVATDREEMTNKVIADDELTQSEGA